MTDEPSTDRWKEHESAFDRVRSIAVTLTQPQSADWIAEQAHVAGNTARDHLQRLVEMNVLQGVAGDGATRYRPDPLYTRMRALRDILDGRDRDELIELRADLQEQIESWQAEYDAESPDDLREHAARSGSADETRDLRRTASDWDIVRYRRRLVEDAIEHYSDYTGATHAPA